MQNIFSATSHLRCKLCQAPLGTHPARCLELSASYLNAFCTNTNINPPT